MTCIKCEDEFTPYPNKPGRVNECPCCAEEVAVKYTGNIIYDHKTAASLQINTDPSLTQYIRQATKLQCKGSNLGNNLKVSGLTRTSGACLYTVSGVNAKGKQT
jgi:hypothetical protein